MPLVGWNLKKPLNFWLNGRSSKREPEVFNVVKIMHKSNIERVWLLYKVLDREGMDAGQVAREREGMVAEQGAG